MALVPPQTSDDENLPVEQQSAPAQTMEARIEIVERHLFALVDRMLKQGYERNLSPRDRARIILATLKALEYGRKVPKATGNDGEELSEDDLIAMPKADLEKILKFAAKQLGAKQAKDLLGLS